MIQDEIDITESPALNRFLDKLVAAGMDDQNATFFVDRFSREVLNAAIIRAGIELGQQGLEPLKALATGEQKAIAIRDLYEQQTGRKFNDLIKQYTDILVQSF